MRRALALVALLLAAAPSHADVSAPSAGGLRWRTDAKAAEAEAVKGRRPLLIFFSAEWCMPCKEMLVKSFADKAVAELIAQRFVPLFVDVTNDDAPSAALRDRFHVVALPTLLVRRGSDERLRHEAFLSAAELRALLQQAEK
jgi:thiol:disulfide interchange protein